MASSTVGCLALEKASPVVDEAETAFSTSGYPRRRRVPPKLLLLVRRVKICLVNLLGKESLYKNWE